ncbi:unnamed protein product [Schistosoma margrebowiei]|uniref:Uncharacterized protein n=1 Tax=Schistosoma margrebowiei TaxID=48269 RepID=A0A183LBF6_9TREM|nr:unnamed protein product [Schistosoma margrebowiei]
MQLDDLDFVDDLDLLSHTQLQMLEYTTSIASASAAVGLNINKEKGKIPRYRTSQITLEKAALNDVKSITYLGSTIDEHGGSDADVKLRIAKPSAAYLQLKNICNSKQMSTNTKVRIFKTNEIETCRTIKANIQNIQVFINSCRREILPIR